MGLIAALGPELGTFATFGETLECPSRVSVRAGRLADGRVRLFAVESGVGKVAAATAAVSLIAHGVDLLLVVGTCGGLARGAVPGARVGDLVHADRAVQWDLAVREGRESTPSLEVARTWQRVAGGTFGAMLTADRPAVRWISRARRARAFRRGGGGLAVADMETAAVGVVAARAGVPWAALRAVSDRRGGPLDRVLLRRPAGTFADHFAKVAGLAAGTVPSLLLALVQPSQ